MRRFTLPFTDPDIHSLHVGDSLSLCGLILTARDAVHQWLVDTFINHTHQPQGNDLATYKAIQPLLNSGMLYHCGPIVAGLATKQYRVVSAGPTTSIREEPYQGEVMRHFNLKAVAGKGGMGAKTLAACQEIPAVYLHVAGGAAAIIAQSIKRVYAVYKLEFGVPEAIWILEVENFPAVVTMDSHGNSLHAQVEARSKAILDQLLAQH